MIAASNLSYKFILDPIYQAKNVVIDFTDSQLIYSKDKKNFAKNYVRAAIAVANNSEVFNEFKEVGLAELGTGWKAPKVKYDKDGNISYNQNKFQRIFANLEAMPKLAEYLSLKDKYINTKNKDGYDIVAIPGGSGAEVWADDGIYPFIYLTSSFTETILLTLSIHSENDIYCGHASSHLPHPTHI